jgi:hypothetical protein
LDTEWLLEHYPGLQAAPLFLSPALVLCRRRNFEKERLRELQRRISGCFQRGHSNTIFAWCRHRFAGSVPKKEREGFVKI